MGSCGCRCALVLTEEQLHVCQYYKNSIICLIRRIRYIFSFSCSYTIRNIPGSQYLEYVDPGNVLLVMYSSVFTCFGVDVATPQKLNMGFLRRFSPP